MRVAARTTAARTTAARTTKGSESNNVSTQKLYRIKNMIPDALVGREICELYSTKMYLRWIGTRIDHLVRFCS